MTVWQNRIILGKLPVQGKRKKSTKKMTGKMNPWGGKGYIIKHRLVSKFMEKDHEVCSTSKRSQYQQKTKPHFDDNFFLSNQKFQIIFLFQTLWICYCVAYCLLPTSNKHTMLNKIGLHIVICSPLQKYSLCLWIYLFKFECLPPNL